MVIFVLLPPPSPASAEAPNGFQQRYICFHFTDAFLPWILGCVLFPENEVVLLNCRSGGKSMHVRKNHSGSSLTHNHKLFSGDMLSFIQVDPAPLL